MVYIKLPLDISSLSSDVRHWIYNHVSHITSGDADNKTSGFYHSANDPFKFVIYIYFFRFFMIKINFSVRDVDETSTVGSHDSSNGFDLNNDDQVADFVRKFVDKICDQRGVNATHKNGLWTKLYRTFLFFLFLQLFFFL
jgi:hypothetical protein